MKVIEQFSIDAIENPEYWKQPVKAVEEITPVVESVSEPTPEPVIEPATVFIPEEPKLAVVSNEAPKADEKPVEETPAVATPEIKAITAETEEFIDPCEEKQDYYISKHKYKIGDMVWYPSFEHVSVMDSNFRVHNETKRIPRKMTISAVLINNKVCYMFKETTKNICAEIYLRDTEAECKKVCEDMNNGLI